MTASPEWIITKPVRAEPFEQKWIIQDFQVFMSGGTGIVCTHQVDFLIPLTFCIKKKYGDVIEVLVKSPIEFDESSEFRCPELIVDMRLSNCEYFHEQFEFSLSSLEQNSNGFYIYSLGGFILPKSVDESCTLTVDFNGSYLIQVDTPRSDCSIDSSDFSEILNALDTTTFLDGGMAELEPYKSEGDDDEEKSYGSWSDVMGNTEDFVEELIQDCLDKIHIHNEIQESTKAIADSFEAHFNQESAERLVSIDSGSEFSVGCTINTEKPECSNRVMPTKLDQLNVGYKQLKQLYDEQVANEKHFDAFMTRQKMHLVLKKINAEKQQMSR